MSQIISVSTPQSNSDLALRKFGFFLLLLALCFCVPLMTLVRTALKSDLHSHVFLIPFICAYLLRTRNPLRGAQVQCSWGWAGGTALLGLLCLSLPSLFRYNGMAIAADDNLSLLVLAFVWLILAGGFLFFGMEVMRVAAFPAFFLFFMVPLPSPLVDLIEFISQQASAEVAAWLITISGTPMIKTGLLIQLPGITIQVGPECSGIRSSYVLFITSLLAGYLFLDRPAHRTWLSLAVIPLGFFRNGLRIFTISMLCVHVDPTMINSIIHRRGGPLFFVLSLLPLFLLLYWFRRRESRDKDQPQSTTSIKPQGQS